MSFVIVFLAIYFLFAFSGLETYENKKLRKGLSAIGILILVPTIILIFILFSWAGGLGVSGGLGGAGLAILLIAAIAISMPILGFFSGIFSRYFFEKAKSSPHFRRTKNIAGVLILVWPLIIVGTVSAVTYPEQQRRKEARIGKAEKRAVERATQKRERDERKQAELKLYEDKQKDKVYRFNLAGNDIDLKAFKYLRVSFNSEDLDDKGLRLWGNTLEDYENKNGAIDNNDIYRVYVQKIIFRDGCPNTNLEIAHIWCSDDKVADINYRPYELGRLAFEKRSKRQKLEPVFSYDKSDLSLMSSGMDFRPYHEERIWRINKTPEFENIYSDIYLACPWLSERSKSRGYGGNCYIGFRLNEDIFVNMFTRIKSENLIESDSRLAVRQSLKYWDLIHN